MTSLNLFLLKFVIGSHVMNINRMANAPYLDFEVPWSILLVRESTRT